MQGAETTNVHPGLRIQDHEQGTLRSVCLAVDSRRVTLTRAEKGSTRRDRPTRQVVRRTTYQVVRGQFLAYLTTERANNGGTEAINGIIELHRRIARGFRNATNYRLRMILA